jgi:hypothetical protein
MPSYEPVDLSAACNAGVEVLSGGPLLTLPVDGFEPGGTVGLSGPFAEALHALDERSRE